MSAVNRPLRKIAFVSTHCVLDFTNGAATATLDGLTLLARSGFECNAFCRSHMDDCKEVLVEEVLAKRRVRYVVRNAQIGTYRARMNFTTHGKVPVTIFNSASTRGGWINAEESAAFLKGCEIFLDKNRPDVVWTYGGDPVSCELYRLIKRLGIPIVLALHNFAYRDAAVFGPIDYAVVPTEFAQRFYRETIGLECRKLPLVLNDARTRVSQHQPRYLTFVNPEPRKGLCVVARIADVLAHRRPDIPLLIVEGAARVNRLSQLGIDLGALRNVKTMPNTPDPQQFYAITKLLLMPSLMENAGFAAMEAMDNGIPVLASNRGGLPETIGDAGHLFDIPARYTPETRDLPTAEEVEPWVETIVRLWDDAAEFGRWSRAALLRAQQWHPDRLGPIYREFFGGITQSTSVAATPSAQRTNPADSVTMSADDPCTSWRERICYLCELPEEELAKLDIAMLNLVCARLLPGSEGVDFTACLRKLDEWARLVRLNTEHWWPNFVSAPEKFNHSPNRFRMTALVTMLQRHLGVHYYLPFNEGDYNALDSQNLFIHGLLGGHGGTCVTMPVLYIAVGRRLGYPLKLVEAYDTSLPAGMNRAGNGSISNARVPALPLLTTIISSSGRGRFRQNCATEASTCGACRRARNWRTSCWNGPVV